ncbi:uncharacterized protein LOC128305880 [Anopheles moucheti]|uniref:uncharacterized protein LOC128305880 n=1 Tax=Anopheles moucheti TaxID=186751 RepID=UPI0022F07DAB|nr:uncharacterized protein LOC128305880 [Anopheles moucheti]
MATIGKSPRSVNRVKSEHILTGPKMNRPGTLMASSTPSNTKIPMSKSSISPQTVIERKTIVSRRKMMIGDAKSHLTCSSKSSKVRDIIYDDTSDKLNPCTCDPELVGNNTSHPNCTFVNICNEHRRCRYHWREYLWWLWRMIGWSAMILLACIVAFLVYNAVLNGGYWMASRKLKASINEEIHVVEESMLHDDEEDETELVDHNLMVFNPKDYSLTDTTPKFNILDLFIMTLDIMNIFFGWIGAILLPNEQ